MGGDRLAPYLCDLHRDWLAREPQTSWRELDGSLLFFDISGFTPLTERLAKRGKAGVEQLVETLNGVVAPLVGTAAALGGDTLKFGGDALLLLFSGDEHERRACAAAFDMQATMEPYRRLRTDAGVVSLRASAAVASGQVDLFLAGDRFRELLVAGPTTSEVMGLESDANAGEVLLGVSTCARLQPACRGTDRGDGVTLLAARPDVAHVVQPPPALDDSGYGLPAALHDHLGPAAESEHRQVTVAFAQFRGLDELLQSDGPLVAAGELHALVARAQKACDDHGVTFLATDADRGAGKIFAVTGAPTASTDDEDRMLFAMREIVAHEGALRVRAGVNRGRAFVVHLGAPQRRTYTAMGDTTNLAARVMGKTPDGQVLATRAVLECARAPFVLAPVAPFSVKGKQVLIDAELVGEPRAVAVRAVPDSAIAGRDAELAILRGAITAARTGEGRIIELVAEPGMGKSRLVAAVTGEAGEEGLHTVLIEAGAYGTATPYFALKGPLRALLEATDPTPDALAAALTAKVREHLPQSEPLLPLIGLAFGLELPETKQSERLSSDYKRTQLHFLVDRLVAALLPPRETLLIIEDAHWLDEASTDLLGMLLQRAGELGWAVFVTRRPGDSGLSQLPGAHMRINLEPLSRDAARSLVLAGGDGTFAPHVTAALVERSNGNPFFLRELIAAARAGAELDELPATVEALLTARIDTLMPTDRRLLRRAAVLGQRFPLSWLSGMLDQQEDELRDALARLSDFLEVEPDRVRFNHALQREAAYEALPFGRRRALHGRAAELIERELGDAADESADILALHFLRAREYRRAWSYGCTAAEQARERAAHADAAVLYRRAIEAACALKLADDEMAAVWEAQGEAYSSSGDLTRANESFTRARRHLTGDTLQQARLMQRHARAAMDGGQIVRAARWLLRGMRLLEGFDRTGAPERRAALAAELAGVRVRQARWPDAIALCRAAIADAEPAHADVPLAHACYILDWALTEAGRGAEAVHSARALEIYRRIGDLDRESAVLNNLGMFAYHAGRWHDAVELYGRSSRAAKRAGNLGSAAFGDCNIGEVMADQGREVQARLWLGNALEIWRGTGYAREVAFASGVLGRLEGRKGRLEEALVHLRRALDAFQSLRLSPDALWIETLIPEAYVLNGRPDEVLADVVRLLDVAGGGRPGAMLHRVHGIALAQIGRHEAARDALETSLREARGRGEEFEIALTLDALCALSERDGDVDHAGRSERDAIVARLDIVGLPPVALDRRPEAPRRRRRAAAGGDARAQ